MFRKNLQDMVACWLDVLGIRRLTVGVRLITPDWELGVRLGSGLNDQSPNFFANVGGGIRF
jgi:hypothetical protein